MSDVTTWSRRDFFKIMGLSASAAAAACSRAPVEKVIPYVQQPDDLTPGVASWYASTCAACPAACGILLKTREGRPIKVEGNGLHPVSRGGVCAVGQAAVLSLYDASRAIAPGTAGKPTTWKDLDKAVRDKLRELAAAGRALRVVVPAYVGPSAEAAIARFVAKYPTARRVRHDPFGLDAIAEAHRQTHGVSALPAYRLESAQPVVSFGADFLGTWLQPVAFTRQYVNARDPSRAGGMLRHLQIESHLTLTGSNADVRLTLAPSQQLATLQALAARLGVAVPAVSNGVDTAVVERIAGELERARGASLVLCGSGEVAAQVLVNSINEALGNIGNTVAVSDGVLLPESQSFEEFLAELRAGEVAAVIIAGVNPVYSHPSGAEFGELLAKVELTVAASDRPDETASHCQHLAVTNHFLESWADHEAERGVLSLSQPAVAPLYDTRPAFESLLVWAGGNKAAYDFVRDRWRSEVFKRAADKPADFDEFWERSVRDGVARYAPEPLPAVYQPEAVSALLASRAPAPAPAGLEVVLYSPVALLDGSLANNGWLQELPDPLTKVTWTNTACLAPATAKELGVEDGELVTLAVGGASLKVPAAIQPGTHPRVVAVAVGYGRTHAGPLGSGVGSNAFTLAGSAGRPGAAATIARTGERIELARTQTQDSLGERDLVREFDVRELPGAAQTGHGGDAGGHSMWSKYEYPGHRWAMAIDLSACTGCSACVVSCQAENNIPIVGVDEVRRGRELHWLRIDRYYAGSAEEPRVLFQPMTCQQCENAPCETVCPVLATTHTSEGLNAQVYNRCIGTRYCANNCPFKVRRFNWFDYERNATERMVLNPEVVVRSRGVMEKCTFCIQRIEEGKTRARLDGRPLQDGEVQSACQQSCPAGAIVFGDLNDRNSRVAQLAGSGRAYRLLTELNVEPAVRYLARVRDHGRAV
ncbi:MAG: 4Fe-4S dicluster domain-containing protein [Deltaproteobacteria bacterium]|nr:4Fe-4S dicluster domain-containing protein [Deltaproteobacteria bacterium]